LRRPAGFWDAEAAALGWRAEDLFGADRVGLRRLTWFIGEGELVAITAETATIQKPSAARQTCCLRPGDAKSKWAGGRRRLRGYSRNHGERPDVTSGTQLSVGATARQLTTPILTSINNQ
jgi:hypothetical protein